MTFESRLIFLTNPIVETHDFAILRIFFAHENVLEAATVVRTLAARGHLMRAVLAVEAGITQALASEVDAVKGVGVQVGKLRRVAERANRGGIVHERLGIRGEEVATH